jgi:hypothetical protein
MVTVFLGTSIVIVHREGGSFFCPWKECGRKGYQTIKSFRAHLKKMHNQQAHAGNKTRPGEGSAKSQGVKMICTTRESAIA